MSENKQRMTRRQFLFSSALGVAGAALAACAPSTVPAETTKPAESQPTAPPVATQVATTPPGSNVPSGDNSFSPKIKVAPKNEAPMLKEMVSSGNLPTLADRMPGNPLVLKPVNGSGEFGGTIRTMSSDLGQSWMQHQYGFSPVRWAHDGEEIIPGIFESWETNADNSEWKFYLRKGLKWSDGEPCTVDDIMFWWNDMVINPNQPTSPPDWGVIGGKLVEMTKVDDQTLKMNYVGTSVFTLQRLASWSKGGVGYYFIVPAHYLKQFHPTYNPDMTDFKTFNEKVVIYNNPDCPSLNPWKVDKLNPGTNRVWARNPYYYVVDLDGNQLPYIDGINETQVADVEVQKLTVTQGDIDFVAHTGFILADVSNLKSSETTGDYQVRLWDSGSGTGMNYFWNYDHPDEKIRSIYRNVDFKRAMSFAIDRPTIQKIVYYDTGWPTTGTMTPKSIEFNFNEDAKKFYEKCRDAYVAYDPAKAKSLLDGVGLKDVDNDGFRELPDGSKFDVSIDLPSNASKECMSVLEITRKNWADVGLNIIINQLPAAEFNTMWVAGQGSIRTNWECTGTVEQLAWGDWLVPKEPTRWAPLCGNRKALVGTPQEDTELDTSPWDRTPPRWASSEAGYKDGTVSELDAIYDVAIMETDPVKRYAMTQQIIGLHVDKGPFLIGTVANYPKIVIVSNKMYNVPTRDELAKGGMLNTWTIPGPAMYGPETFSFKKA